MNKSEAKKAVDDFFSKPSFSADEVRKIRNLAMKHRIRLGKYRRLFCKCCLYQLKGKARTTKTHKTVICSNCGQVNRFRLS